MMAETTSFPTFNNETCAICCSTDNLKRCARCKSVAYCSRDHQKQDWKVHKSVCKPKSTPNSNNTPARLETNDKAVAANGTSLTSQDKGNGDGESEVISQQKEIESILDFSSVSLPTEVARNAAASSSENSKDIFTNLINSDQDTYHGPKTDFEVGGVSECHTECLEDNQMPGDNQILENNEESSGQDLQTVEVEDEDSDLTPFDSRPLRRLKFPKPESYDPKDLAEFVSLRLINLGYCVVDDVFTPEVIDGVLSELKELKGTNELKTGQLAGGRTSGNDSEKVTETAVRSDLIKWIEGTEASCPFAGQVLATMDSVVDCINNSYMKSYGFIQGRTKAMLACYPGNGTYYRRHVDNTNKDGRRITCILYLNKDWDIEKDGGLLCLLPPHLDKPVDIPPLANRLLFFWSDRRNPHEVHPAFKDRYAMTVWYFDSDEREAAKMEEIQQETLRINAQIEQLEEKRRQMQEMTMTQEIENRAMEAVRALSEQELEALTILMRTQPNARQLLSSMGISDSIQDALVQLINS